jgi:hypothetical protein
MPIAYLISLLGGFYAAEGITSGLLEVHNWAANLFIPKPTLQNQTEIKADHKLLLKCKP